MKTGTACRIDRLEEEAIDCAKGSGYLHLTDTLWTTRTHRAVAEAIRARLADAYAPVDTGTGRQRHRH